MTILFSNNASTTISGSITAAATSVALAAGTGVLFPLPTGTDFFVCTFYDQSTKTINEIVHVTNITGDVATIVRAQEGTTARAWNAGDIFANLITAGTLRAFVQTVAPSANTSLLYVGTDTGTPNHIIAVTNPVPASLAVGMVFVILVENANTGATDMALNGLPAHPCKRTDGSDFVSGDIYAGLEYIFIWNGTNFSSTIMNVVQGPPQYIFYVRADSTSIVNMTTGIESNTGLANTAAAAFKTLQGAANTIALRYVSSQSYKIVVADGTYTSGFSHQSQYIASIEYQGNDANPQNVVINCTSTADASYVPGSFLGVCFMSAAGGNLLVHGFTFQSYGQNAASSGGYLEIYGCNFSSPTSGETSSMSAAIGGQILLHGVCKFTSTTGGGSIFEADQSGTFAIAGISDFASDRKPLTWTWLNNVACQSVMWATDGGVISVGNAPGNIVVNGPPTTIGAPEFIVQSAGGVSYNVSVGSIFNAEAGIVYPPGWSA
jgi:hypothetical protein